MQKAELVGDAHAEGVGCTDEGGRKGTKFGLLRGERVRDRFDERLDELDEFGAVKGGQASASGGSFICFHVLVGTEETDLAKPSAER